MDAISVLKGFSYLAQGIVLVKYVSAGIMCIYGYKWSKRLIANVSIYLGFILGVLVFRWMMELGAGIEAIIFIPIVTVGFYEAAYRNVALNHFLAAFLVSVKISSLIMLLLIQGGSIESTTTTLFVAPAIVGIICGFIGLLYFNNYVLIFCVAYIGATELADGLMSLFNGTLFAYTGNYSYIVSLEPSEILLSFMGIDVPSFWETVLIIVIFIFSFRHQKSMVDKNGIDLTTHILNDTETDIKIEKK